MAWWKPAATFADQTLRGISDWLKGQLRMVRLLRFLLAAGLVAAYASLVGAIVWPEQTRWFFGIAVVGLSLPLMYWYVLLSIPLQARSIVRLIDEGYPQNVKELAIRAAARKLHDESIETEELLVETAWNETKKAYRKYMARAETIRDDLDEEAPVDDAGKP